MNGSGVNDDDFINTRPSAIMQFLTHVFSTTTEGKAEVWNIFQYVILASIPIFLLNKGIATFIPGADEMKSTTEIAVEIIAQLGVMFGGIILIHRCITYIPTYSGYKYDPLMLTNSILTFLILIFSIQSKLSAKMNTLYFRAQDMFDSARGIDTYSPPPVSSKAPPALIRHDPPEQTLSEPTHMFSVKPTSSGIHFN